MRLHFDFCYISKRENGLNYVIILNYGQTGSVWFTPTNETTADAVAATRIRWFSTLGLVEQWVSDRGIPLKNMLVRILRQRTKSSHHYTRAYCLGSNGPVEVVFRVFLQVVRELLSEYQLPKSCRRSVFPVVWYALNSTVISRRGNRCPLRERTGLPQGSPLKSFVRHESGKVQVQSGEDIRHAQNE